MYKDKRIVALIPARGGSKGLPRKNVLPLNGKPLIAWTIEQAKASVHIDRVIVSTDDEEIASVARAHGADVPFLRPKELASDTAKAMDVILHALSWLEENRDRYDVFVLLQPTSPLRTTEDIDNALTLLFSKDARAIVSVCETEHHPYWSNVLPADGSLDGFLRPDIMNKNRQELPTFYRLNGAINAAYCDHLRTGKTFFGKGAYAFVMPGERSVDIDTRIDFQLAELLIGKKPSSQPCQRT
jgi:N-acylneuraminate cytidylyltransferase/CMP-N,N'-diacetyllegionaminic acid synthase